MKKEKLRELIREDINELSSQFDNNMQEIDRKFEGLITFLKAGNAIEVIQTVEHKLSKEIEETVKATSELVREMRTNERKSPDVQLMFANTQLIEGMKELKQRNKDLENTNTELRQQNKKLKQELNAELEHQLTPATRPRPKPSRPYEVHESEVSFFKTLDEVAPLPPLVVNEEDLDREDLQS